MRTRRYGRRRKVFKMVKWVVCKTSRQKRKSTVHSHSNRKMIHLQWRGGPTIPKPGKKNCKERLDSFRYRKKRGISECRKRPLTICDGRFPRGRRGAYETRLQVSAQCATIINIEGEGKPHQNNIINIYRTIGINKDAKYIFKLTIHTVFLLLPTLQLILWNY